MRGRTLALGFIGAFGLFASACGGSGASGATSGSGGETSSGTSLSVGPSGSTTSSGATTTSGSATTSGGGASTTTSSSGATTSSTTSSGTSSSGGGALGGCTLFPADNMWNTPIDQLPVHPLSDQYIAAIGAGTGLHPDFGPPYNGAPNGIPFVVVPANQTPVDVSFDYADESDPGPYPVPANAPIEGGPQGDGDRHILIVQQGSCTLYELYSAYPMGNAWQAGSGAIWHLDKNEQRPDGWTSADAAGLAVLPGLVRYDEAVTGGAINHAIRVTVSSAQSAYMHPATHSDGQGGMDPTHPPMGLRLRLKASVDISGLPPEVQVMAKAMKKYGLVVADTGSDWYVSGAPDDQWNDDNLHALGQLQGSDFEAVDTGEGVHPY